MTEFSWDPDGYLALMAEEIADYPGLQEQLVAATRESGAHAILDLGCGSGETARRVLEEHPAAHLLGVDANTDMLAAARDALDPARTELRRQRLEEELPRGPFDLVVSALAVHHLDGPGKADLFRRVAERLVPGGRFVLADLVRPERAEEAFTEIDGVEDKPSSLADQLAWLDAAGLSARTRWRYRDLAVLVADKPDRTTAASQGIPIPE